MTETFESRALDPAVVAGIRNRQEVPALRVSHTDGTSIVVTHVYDMDRPESYWHVVVTRLIDGIYETSGQDYLAWAPNRPDGLDAHAAVGDALQAAGL
jgi:hypothetical protein